MRAVWLEPDEDYLEKRRRHGQDRLDEVWDGVLHMVPPPSSLHHGLGFELSIALRAIGRPRGLVAHPDGMGVFGSIKNYRIPDVTLARPDQISKRGLEGAELVVEILSPSDESRDKFPFYAHFGVREIWLIEAETRAIEIFTARRLRWPSLRRHSHTRVG